MFFLALERNKGGARPPSLIYDTRIAASQPGHARHNADDEGEDCPAPGWPGNAVDFALEGLVLRHPFPDHTHRWPEENESQDQSQQLGMACQQGKEPGAQDDAQNTGPAQPGCRPHIQIAVQQVAIAAGDGGEDDGEQHSTHSKQDPHLVLVCCCLLLD